MGTRFRLEKIHLLWWLLVGGMVACGPPDGYRVACVGDSITFGDGLVEPERESYPAQLQQLMGEGVVVRNYGRNGRTLLKQGHAPYWREEALQDAIAFQPHAVILMLGTNDSKPVNWQHADAFVGDYLALIDTFLALPQVEQVLVCTPPPVYQNGFEIQGHTVSQEITPLVRQLAAERPITLVEIHQAMAGHPEWFGDGVHPNAAGALELAKAVAPYLKP